MRIFLAILVSVITAVESQPANTEPPAPRGTESLGSRLLDDLSPNSIHPNSAPQAAQPTKPANAAPATGGFGVGANPASQPLLRVQHNMHHAELLLTQPGNRDSTGPVRLAGTVQQEVLSDLDQLIAELSKQCQCNGGQCQGDKPPKPGSKPGKPGVAAGQGRSAARFNRPARSHDGQTGRKGRRQRNGEIAVGPIAGAKPRANAPVIFR